MHPLYWALIILGVIAYIGMRVYLYTGARTSSLREWADRDSFTFQSENDPSIGQRYSELSRLTRFQNCTACNIIRGPLGRYKFCAFDFVDIDRRRGSNIGHKTAPVATSFAAVVVETDLRLPPVILERETLSHKVARVFGALDVQFESEEFNRRFAVRSPDKVGAVTALGSAAQELLTQSPLFEFSAALHILEFHGSLVLARSRTDQLFDENVYPEVLELISALLALIAASSAKAETENS
jgi:hypothetical protein